MDEMTNEDWDLTLKLMSPFLQHRQASMRKTNVKSPEKETATTTRVDGHDSSLNGEPPGVHKQTFSLKRCSLNLRYKE